MMEAAARRRSSHRWGRRFTPSTTIAGWSKSCRPVRSGRFAASRCGSTRRCSQPFASRNVPPFRKGLNYDLWLGPAPERGYPAFRTGANTSVHFHWRWWWDFGGGVLADMACHFMDLPHWALNLRHPTNVTAVGRVTYKGDNEMPDRMQVDYDYPAHGNRPGVHLTWYHGVAGPDLDGKITHNGYSSGVLFEGANGSLIANYTQHRFVSQPPGFERPRQTIAASVGHHREWLQAIRTGGATTCNFDYSGALAETVLLGNVAYRAGGKLTYDGRTGRVTGNANAERYLRREYRKGWTL